MPIPEDVGASVESCLSETWAFLTGGTLRFRQTETLPTLKEPCTGFTMAFYAAGARQQSGIMLILSGSAIGEAGEFGCELCNIFSGCVTRLFKGRENFEIGLPICLSGSTAKDMIGQISILHCFTSECGRIAIATFNAGEGFFPKTNQPCHASR